MRGPDAIRASANRRSPGLRRRAAVLISSLALLPGFTGLVGCNTTGKGNNSALTNDPLVGGGPPLPTARSANQSPAGATAAVPATPMMGAPTGIGAPAMPAIQAPTGTPSTAALAVGSAQPINPASTLRIGQPQPVQPAAPIATGGWTGSPTPMAGTPNQGALLRPPATPTNTAAGVGAATPIAATAPQPQAVASGGSDEQLQSELKVRHVQWQRSETTADGKWKFVCSVPNKQNPNITRTYEGVANDRLSAIKAVIEKIDTDKN